MSKQKTTRGKTSRSLPVFIADTSSTTGGGLSGVTSASSGLVLEYRRQGQSTWTSVTPQAGKTLGSYLSGGIAADTGLAGAYEVDFPDAAFASAAGVEWVALRIRGVTNMLAVLIEIELDAVDYQDAAAFGLSKFSDIEADTQNIQSRLPAALVDGRIVAQAQSVTDKSGYTLTQAFPANFSSMVINAGNGHVAVVVHAFQNGVLTAAAIAAGALNGKGDWLTSLGATAPANWINAAAIADGAIDAGSIAADALNGKGNWLTSLGANAPAGWINAASITTDAITGDKIDASAVTKITVNLFKYGDIQLWTSPANQIQVSITKV